MAPVVSRAVHPMTHKRGSCSRQLFFTVAGRGGTTPSPALRSLRMASLHRIRALFAGGRRPRRLSPILLWPDQTGNQQRVGAASCVPRLDPLPGPYDAARAGGDNDSPELRAATPRAFAAPVAARPESMTARTRAPWSRLVVRALAATTSVASKNVLRGQNDSSQNSCHLGPNNFRRSSRGDAHNALVLAQLTIVLAA